MKRPESLRRPRRREPLPPLPPSGAGVPQSITPTSPNGKWALASMLGRSAWTPELALLAALLALMALFGRPFSKIGVPSAHVYVTEVALVVLVALLLVRLGPAGLLARIRSTIPFVPLLVLWLAGLIATLRGLADFGLAQILPEVGLFEYSVFLPLVAVVVDTPARAALLLRTLFYAGLGAIGVAAYLYFAAPESSLRTENPGSAAAIYMAFFSLVVAARVAWRSTVRAWEAGVAVVGLVLMSLLVIRSVVLAVLCALLAIALLLPGRRRVMAVTLVAGALCVSVAGAVVIQTLGIGVDSTPMLLPKAPVAGPDFVADDGSSDFRGGLVIEGDAAGGRLSRQLERRHLIELPALDGLRPGRTYTIDFAVKPLEPKITRGVVGDSSGLGWRMEIWTTAPAVRWQQFRKTLTATGETERLVLLPYEGAARVRVDAVKVLSGREPGLPGEFRVQTPVAGPDFVADDGSTAFQGGETVVGDAAAGRRARELRRGELLELPALRGLVAGTTYTVEFAVKPTQGIIASGVVGDTSGRKWGMRSWTAAPIETWQRFRKTLVATAEAERLVIYPLSGPARIRIDAVAVLRNRSPGRPGDYLVQRPVAAPSFVADDAAGAFIGGEFVEGGAASGRLSRELKRSDLLELPSLTGLRPGRTYTVEFSVRPLERSVTTGVVGDTSGRKWGMRRWTSAPVTRWQRFRKTLTATASRERLVLMALTGADRVRFDAVKVLTGRRSGPPGDYEVQAAVADPGFVSDDAGTAFQGGETILNDAVRGSRSRQLERGELLELPTLRGLRPGGRYTIRFAVKPLQRTVTSGVVGDTSGRRWGMKRWTAAPDRRWQRFQKTLTATRARERLVLLPLAGATRVRVDDIRVELGHTRGPSGDFRIQRAIAAPDFVANDAGTSFLGDGEVVSGDAYSGRSSRELRRGQLLEVPTLRGLRPGQLYTIRFSVRPLQATVTKGSVGDTSGRGWGGKLWRTSPTTRWHRFSKTLTATAPTERLVLSPVAGAETVRFDAIRVALGARPDPEPRATATPGAIPPARGQPPSSSRRRPRRPVRVLGEGTLDPEHGGPPLVSNFRQGLESDSRGEAGNMYWRLDIWRHTLETAARTPLLGVGFGRPTAFRKGPDLYDARLGDAKNPYDVTAPHNSFVNLAFRTGLLGFVPLMILIGVAFARAIGILRSPSASRELRLFLTALTSLFVFIIVIAFFNVALEGPYMGIFFWTILGLLLVAPRLSADNANAWQIPSNLRTRASAP